MVNKRIKILAIMTIIALMAWAPWLNNQEIHDRVLVEKGTVDGTIDKQGNIICDYSVRWIPFGRYVASCEGGWFITFWGQII